MAIMGSKAEYIKRNFLTYCIIPTSGEYFRYLLKIVVCLHAYII